MSADKKKWVGGWVYGWVGESVHVEAVLCITYRGQNYQNL
jgi:hypothetical protein